MSNVGSREGKGAALGTSKGGAGYRLVPYNFASFTETTNSVAIKEGGHFSDRSC